MKKLLTLITVIALLRNGVIVVETPQRYNAATPNALTHSALRPRAVAISDSFLARQHNRGQVSRQKDWRASRLVSETRLLVSPRDETKGEADGLKIVLDRSGFFCYKNIIIN